jgi:hypothetical protein
METKGKAFQRLVVAGYLGLTLLFIVIYFLAGYLPQSSASLATLLQDVALNLAIALTISFGSYVLLRPLIEDSNRKTLEDFQAKALDLLSLEKGVREAGVVRVYESLKDASLLNRLAEAKERIWFLSIWMDKPETLLDDVLDRLVQHKVKVKVLLASPESDVCKLRAQSQANLFPDLSSFQPEFIARVTQANNAYFEKVKTKTGADIEVRSFNVLPPFSLVLVDNNVLIGLYGHGERTTSVPWIEFKLTSEGNDFSYFRAFILNQFNAIWDSATKTV